jgi:prevent-host-death family protein
VERLSAVELRRRLAEVMNRADYQGQRFVIHRREKDAVAIISIEDLELMERLIRQEEDRIDVEAARIARQENDYVPYGDFRAATETSDGREEQPVSSRDIQGRRLPARKVAKERS